MAARKAHLQQLFRYYAAPPLAVQSHSHSMLSLVYWPHDEGLARLRDLKTPTHMAVDPPAPGQQLLCLGRHRHKGAHDVPPLLCQDVEGGDGIHLHKIIQLSNSTLS
jgi:hypothetical protein